MDNFEKALGTVMKEVLARPDKFKLERNDYNDNTLTVTIYGNRAIEITVKSNGNIILIGDKDRAEMLWNNKRLSKEFREFSKGNVDRGTTLARAEYGHTELEKFANDFKMLWVEVFKRVKIGRNRSIAIC